MRLRTLGHRTGVADTRTARPAPKQADPFYRTAAWSDLRADLIRIRGARCEHCQRTGSRLFADHIVELKDGGAALDPANLQLLCGACHTAKTSAARAARQRG